MYRDGRPAQVRLRVPGLARGRYRITCWDTLLGHAVDMAELDHRGGMLDFQPPGIAADLATAICRIG